MATIEERVRALEDSENEDLIDILLDIVHTLEEELGVNKKTVKRKIKALVRKQRQPGQHHLNMPK